MTKVETMNFFQNVSFLSSDGDNDDVDGVDDDLCDDDQDKGTIPGNDRNPGRIIPELTGTQRSNRTLL